MNKNRSVFYDEKHMGIVMKGIDAISSVLKGTDMAEKERLLFCLDRYLDPWFGYNLPYEAQIFELIQYVVISPNSINVKEDALNLLEYSNPPFPILASNLDKIEIDLMGYVQYTINRDI